MPTVGALPVSGLPAMIDVGLAMAGRSLASMIVPVTVNSMVFDAPGGSALAAVMAALRDPTPLSLRLVTVNVAITNSRREAAVSSRHARVSTLMAREFAWIGRSRDTMNRVVACPPAGGTVRIGRRPSPCDRRWEVVPAVTTWDTCRPVRYDGGGRDDRP